MDENQREELIQFIDNNFLEISDDAEQFKNSIKIAYNYFKEKGPIDSETEKYFENLINTADEIMSIKAKGIPVSTSSLFPSNKKEAEKPKEETTQNTQSSQSNHYSYGCASDSQRSYHYSHGC